MLAEVRRLASLESPSGNRPALDAVAELIAARARSLGGSVEVLRDDQGGPHLRSVFFSESNGRPALVLGHFDTVWPVGTLEKMPLREEGGRLYGPGVYDMKASLVMVHEAVGALRELGLSPPRPLVVVFTSDEEIGSPGSRPLIEETARTCDYVLVPEPPLADGSLKTARKGVGRFRLRVEGKAAHAGVAPELGASAIVELAHQILKIQSLNDPQSGTTLNVGVIHGGTTANVVPAEAEAHVDARATTLAAAARVETAMRELRPEIPGTRLFVDGGFTRPPMERSPAIAALFAQAREIARGMGLDLSEGATGGGSDGNFTAALGIPTLDGLGIRGGGAHALDEHIIVESLPERAALLAHLILRLSV
jgi:glutamate carboxypeptidase